MEGLEKIIKKAATYNRVSSDEQREGKNIDSQAAENKKLCVERGYEIYDDYSDDGYSGAMLDRPALDRLRDDARNHLFDVVVINAIDRLARDEYAIAVVLRELQDLDIEVIFVRMPSDNSPEGQLQRIIMTGFSVFERLKILERTRRGRRYKVEVRKQLLGGIPPYGFRYFPRDKSIGEDGHFEIDEVEARVVRQMFKWVGEDGLSSRQVLKRLLDDNVPNRKVGMRWGKSSVLKILKSDSYTGRFFFNRLKAVKTDKHREEKKYRRNEKTGVRVRPRDEWILVEKEDLRIIDEVLFQTVQKQLKINQAYARRNTINEYLLGGGLLRCGLCGLPYYANSSKGCPFYSCSDKARRYPEKKQCKSPSISAKKIEPAVWNKLESMISDPTFLLEQLQKNIDLIEMQPDVVEREQKSINDQIKKIETKEVRLIKGYQDGVFGTEQVKGPLEELRKQKSKLIQELSDLSKRNEEMLELQKAPKSLEDYCKVLQGKIRDADFEAKRKILRLFFKEVIFHKNRVLLRGVVTIPNGSSLEWNGQTKA